VRLDRLSLDKFGLPSGFSYWCHGSIACWIMGHDPSPMAARDVVRYLLRRVFGAVEARKIGRSGVWHLPKAQLAVEQNMLFPTRHGHLGKGKQDCDMLLFLKGREY
jgi:hypothetical protein